MSAVKTILRTPGLYHILRGLIRVPLTRRPIIRYLEDRARKGMLEWNVNGRPAPVQRDKGDLLAAMVSSLDRGLEKSLFSEKVLDKLLRVFFNGVILSEDLWTEASELGTCPPLFLTISPTQRCNLHCTGCYASSGAACTSMLDIDILRRIINEKRDLWGSHFTVISGGEPFLYRNGGKTLLDVVESFPDEFFMVYTNGTLLDDETTGRMAELGNISPAVSVEGFQEETDQRRGRGVHARILSAFENLRRNGIPFGISATATSNNWRTVTSEDFADFYFMEQGASYGWLFQYMPIGRAHTLEMQISPEDRLEMWRRTWRLVRERKLFYADFWNSGTASDGCIAAGRPGGYLYIDWNGNVAPCVFVPYAAANIYDVYKMGGTLNDVLEKPFLKKMREFQDQFAYRRPADEVGNWLCPCSIRDHYDTFYQSVRQTKPEPVDEEARKALDDPQYRQGLIEYGKRMAELTDDIWEKEYLAGENNQPEEKRKPA